jgi:hypothetical protein
VLYTSSLTVYQLRQLALKQSRVLDHALHAASNYGNEHLRRCTQPFTRSTKSKGRLKLEATSSEIHQKQFIRGGGGNGAQAAAAAAPWQIA